MEVVLCDHGITSEKAAMRSLECKADRLKLQTWYLGKKKTTAAEGQVACFFFSMVSYLHCCLEGRCIPWKHGPPFTAEHGACSARRQDGALVVCCTDLKPSLFFGPIGKAEALLFQLMTEYKSVEEKCPVLVQGGLHPERPSADLGGRPCSRWLFSLVPGSKSALSHVAMPCIL